LEIHRLRREVRQVSSGLDAVFKRNSAGLLAQLDVSIGGSAFTVVPIRNAAGHIIEMKRDPETEKVAEPVLTALDHVSRRARA
jgi:hypothetical protein